MQMQSDRARRDKRRFIFGEDHNARPPQRVARVLIDRALHAARHHQADVRAVGHAVGVETPPNRRREAFAVQPDIQTDRRRAREQPVEMEVEKHQRALVQSDALPHPVAHRKPGVENRYGGLGARRQIAVNGHNHVVIARIGDEILSSSHGVAVR